MRTSFPIPGVDRPGGAPLMDRRDDLRFALGQETLCHLVAGVGEALWPARVLDLSARGARLVLRRRFEPGALVLVELANGARVFSCALVMRVVHATRRDDGAWVVGGAFARKLGHNELMALMP